LGSFLEDRFKKLEAPRPAIHRALVVGGDTELGGAVLRDLAARGVEARGLRKWSSAAFADPSGLVSWAVGDHRQRRELEAAVAGCDVMVWAAPISGGIAQVVGSVRGGLKVAAGAELSRFVFVSSLATVGESSSAGAGSRRERGRPLGEVDERWHLACGYAELEVLKAAGCGLPGLVVNPTWWMGAEGVAPDLEPWLRACVEGRVRAVSGGLVNVIDIKDAAAGVVLAALRGAEGARYTLGGHNLTLRELADRLSQLAARPGPSMSIPDAALLRSRGVMRRFSGVSGLSEGTLHQMCRKGDVCSERARQELGLIVRPLEETLRETVARLKTLS